MSRFEVRQARIRDAASLSALWAGLMRNNRALFPEYCGLVQGYEALCLRKVSKLIRSRKCLFLIAVDKREGRMAGYLYSRIRKNKPVYRIAKIGILEGLFISPLYRRQGVATALKSAAFRWFRENSVKVAELDVLDRNAPALAAYRKWGFREFKRVLRKKV